jgi:hypothetical protein
MTTRSEEGAAWVRTQAAGAPVLVQAAAGPGKETPEGSVRAVAAEPLAVVGPEGPALSVVVVLDRRPTADLGAIAALVRGASLALDVAIGVPDAALAALDVARRARHVRLFADRVDYTLTTTRGSVAGPGGGHVLATAAASGPTGRAALVATLDRDDALDVLGALRGQPSRLRVSARVGYAVAGTPVTVRLRASWAEVHDALVRHAAQDGALGSAAVRAAVVDLLADGRLAVSGGPPDGVDPDAVTGVLLAQSVVVLDRADESTWRLRARPDPVFPFDHVLRTTVRRTDRLTMDVGLDRLLAAPLAGLSLDRYVSLVAPQSGGSGGLEAVPPRRRSARGPRGDPGDRPQVRLTRSGGHVASLDALVEPRRLSTPTSVFIASAASRPALVRPAAGAITHLPVDDLRVRPLESRREHLPVVDDPDAPVWRDAVDADTAWYAPRLTFVPPDPATAADRSPFLFRFHRTGVTNDVRPALQGTVVVTVRRVPPPDAAAAADSRKLREVPIDEVSAVLEVPFIDRTDGVLKAQALEGTVRPTADGWTVEVAMINDWLRLAYRALSAADPAAPPAVVRLDYTFAAYSPVFRHHLLFAFQEQTALTRIAFTRADLAVAGPDPVFDATTLAMRGGRTDVSFRRERAEPTVSTPVGPVAAARAGGALAVALDPAVRRPLSGAVLADRPLVVLHPTVRPRPLPPAVQAEDPQLVRRSIARRVTAPAVAPCATLGAFYRDTTGGADTAVGCRDELQLGELRYTLYSREPRLSTERVGVHRLLQQPGRFLLSPAAYGITRHEADEGDRAYRPCVVLYGVLDPDDPSSSRIVLDATLQPDLAVHELADLEAELAALDPNPVIHLPTEIDGVTAEFTWAIPGSRSTHATVVLPGGLLRVSIETDLADWMLMRLQLQASFFSGSADFRYPDGSSHRSALVLDLTRVLGPWESGPVEAAVAGRTARLRNRVERTVDVARLVCGGSNGRVVVEVGASLARGAELEVEVPDGTTTALPVVSLPRTDPVVIEETRSFIDQIETNVLFISLVDLAARGLDRLGVQAQLRGVPGERTVQLTDSAPTAEARFVLPLTSYLVSRVLVYRITTYGPGTDAVGESGEWREWDLAREGNVISLSWALVQPAPGEQ